MCKLVHTWIDLNRRVRSAKLSCLDTEEKECAVRYKLPGLEDSAKTIVNKLATKSLHVSSRQSFVFYIILHLNVSFVASNQSIWPRKTLRLQLLWYRDALNLSENSPGSSSTEAPFLLHLMVFTFFHEEKMHKMQTECTKWNKQENSVKSAPHVRPRPRTFAAFLSEHISLSSRITLFQGSHQNGC